MENNFGGAKQETEKLSGSMTDRKPNFYDFKIVHMIGQNTINIPEIF